MTTGRFALASAVVVTGVACSQVAQSAGTRLCKPGADLRPKEAPPAPMGPTQAAGIWLSDVEGRSPRQLAAGPRPTNGQQDVVQWLPDGRLALTVFNWPEDG